MAIPIMKRELERAWRNARAAANCPVRNNAHRLLLFYAAECGLKALYLEMRTLEVLDGKVIKELGHDINKVLDALHAQKSLRVPSDLHAQPYKIKHESTARNCKPDQINEVWRYGAQFDFPHNDAAIEQKLVEINQWIARNLL